jgi:hypothetical protein
MSSTWHCEIRVLEILKTKYACSQEDVVYNRTLYHYQEYVLMVIMAV